MNRKHQAPFVAVLAAELTVLAVGGAIALWVAQKIIIEALKFVVPAVLG